MKQMSITPQIKNFCTENILRKLIIYRGGMFIKISISQKSSAVSFFFFLFQTASCSPGWHGTSHSQEQPRTSDAPHTSSSPVLEYKCAPPCSVLCGTRAKGSVHARQALYQPNHIPNSMLSILIHLKKSYQVSK